MASWCWRSRAVIFGLAFSLLLIATYPQRRKLIPPAIGFHSEPAPAPLEKEPEKTPT